MPSLVEFRTPAVASRVENTTDHQVHDWKGLTLIISTNQIIMIERIFHTKQATHPNKTEITLHDEEKHVSKTHFPCQKIIKKMQNTHCARN